MAETIFLTGATGFIGRELLWRMLRRPEVSVLCLLRSRPGASMSDRLNEVLDAAQPTPLTQSQRSRVTAISGDITQPSLGLALGQFEELAASVIRIVHGAASVAFHLPLEEARRINVDGTRRVLELAEASKSLKRFDYISTCFVCGQRSGLIGEEELDLAQEFNNSYERSKAEAEQLMRSRRSDLPICIFRAPMVAGDSRTGYASSFKVMYWPLKMMSRGYIHAAPGDPKGVVDVVPVDYFCNALEFISADLTQRGRAFHLAAGPECSTTVSEYLDMATAAFGRRRPLLIKPVLYRAMFRPVLKVLIWGRKRDLLNKGRVYLPYLAHHAQFDTSQTRAALAATNLRVPPITSYFQTLINYAVRSEWGKQVSTPIATSSVA